MTDTTPYDLIVVGGGINGCGIAADAAGRGLSVLVVEAGDLAGGTSSASSKLIHGGLRYLETYEFRLVREALAEREVLLAAAPHLASPLRFVIPRLADTRPRWMVRAGLFLYDHLAPRRLIPSSGAVSFPGDAMAPVLRPGISDGFAYWDCWVDDARLVVANALAARQRGGRVLTRTPVTGLHREGALWRVRLGGDHPSEAAARAVVNAAGPWVERVAALRASSGPAGGATESPHVRLVKGSHIVVPRIPGASDALLLQNPDGRVVFVLPFESAFTLIGTTDAAFQGDPRAAVASEEEIAYLLDAANRCLARPLGRPDVVWTFAGVRPLDEPDAGVSASKASRDYRLVVDRGLDGRAPPIVHVLGGKLTTYRRLAEAVMSRLAPSFPDMGPAWTASAALPGGDLGGLSREEFAAAARARWRRLDGALVDALVRRHGSLIDRVLGEATVMADLGAPLGGGLYTREALYFKSQEWAVEAEDILWRRTKCGLAMTAAERRDAVEALKSVA